MGMLFQGTPMADSMAGCCRAVAPEFTWHVDPFLFAFRSCLSPLKCKFSHFMVTNNLFIYRQILSTKIKKALNKLLRAVAYATIQEHNFPI